MGEYAVELHNVLTQQIPSTRLHNFYTLYSKILLYRDNSPLISAKLAFFWLRMTKNLRWPDLRHTTQKSLMVLIMVSPSSSLHVTSYYIMLHHVTSCHIILHHITSCYIMLHHITSCHIMLQHITSCHITLHHVTSCHIISHHITSCYIMLHHYIHVYRSRNMVYVYAVYIHVKMQLITVLFM